MPAHVEGDTVGQKVIFWHFFICLAHFFLEMAYGNVGSKFKFYIILSRNEQKNFMSVATMRR